MLHKRAWARSGILTLLLLLGDSPAWATEQGGHARSWTSVGLSALAAGCVALLVTLAIEKLGGRKGGLLGTVPTTIVPAALGLAHAAPSPEALQAALHSVPVGTLLNTLFLLLWRVVPPRLPRWRFGVRLAAMVALSVGAWSVAATGLTLAVRHIPREGPWLALLGWSVTGLAGVLGVLACLQARPAPAGTRKVGPLALAARGLMAASAIGVAVWLSTAVGPVVAGVASVFPAIFLTTMVSLWVAQGESVQAGAVGPMMLGSTSVPTFALLAAQTLPWLGPWAGAAVAWVGAVLCVTLPAWWWLGRR